MNQPHFDFAAVYQAWRACRRGKHGTRQAQRYEMCLIDKLIATAQAFQTRSWHPSRASRFVTLNPKPREILAADYADRVVHHLLVPWFKRHFEPVFIRDSFAHRRSKGTNASVDQLQAFTRTCAKAKSNGRFATQPSGWYLQLDIANFFHSINRPAAPASLASQWTWFRARYLQHMLLVQVGNRWEYQGPTAAEKPAAFRNASARCKGLPPTWAVDGERVSALKRQLVRQRQPWCQVCKSSFLANRQKTPPVDGLVVPCTAWPAAFAPTRHSTRPLLW